MNREYKKSPFRGRSTRNTGSWKKYVLAGVFVISVHTAMPLQGQPPGGHLAGGEESALTTRYIAPERILWLSDSTGVHVKSPDFLLRDFGGQVSVSATDFCVLNTTGGGSAGILLDFGREYQGALELAAGMRGSKVPLRVRIRLGESVSEAMSDGNSTATNDHALRDFTLEVPWLGKVVTGESGFRFARIDLLDPDRELLLEGVRLAFRYRDIPYLGSFHSDNERLNRIWQTGAYTVHLNMQDYLWDGIKRDRLVWVGDMHPEVMCINTVFGANDVVEKSLDFARDNTPLPGWMNKMCSYSLWWIIIHKDYYLYQGNLPYLRQQHDYLKSLVNQIVSQTEGNRERLRDGTRFLDWPTSEMPEVIDAGLQGMTVSALEAAADIAGWLKDDTLEGLCRKTAARLRGYIPDPLGNKQAASLLALAGLIDPESAGEIIARDGAGHFSTFYGYYMLEALALAGEYEKAMRIISDYWGGMLDLGATTFWEDLDYSDLSRATRIDGFVPEGGYDIHADGGAYCYRGLRHSFCHGWASGPTAWMSRHVLGVVPLEPGCARIRIAPYLGNLERVEGSFPTPHGIIRISHQKLPDGSVQTTVEAPNGVTVVQ